MKTCILFLTLMFSLTSFAQSSEDLNKEFFKNHTKPANYSVYLSPVIDPILVDTTIKNFQVYLGDKLVHESQNYKDLIGELYIGEYPELRRESNIFRALPVSVVYTRHTDEEEYTFDYSIKLRKNKVR